MTTKIKSGVISDNAITSAHISSGAISSSHLTGIDTDAVSEGSSNLYFTTARVDSHLSGGTGVTYSSGAISIGQSVATTDSPTFANLTLTGNLNITGDVDSVSVTDLDVTDKTITVGVGGTASANDGAGLVVDGASASILWDNSNTSWDFNKDINVTGTIDSGAITSTGAITAKSGGGFYLHPTDAHDTDAWILYQYSDNTLRYNFTGAGADEIIIKYPNATNATTLTIDTEQQRVGIGTSSPDTLLELRTDTNSSGYGSYPALTIRNDNTAGYGAIHFNEGSTQRARIEVGNNSGSPYLLMNTGTSSGNGIYIDSAGKVAIGDTSAGTYQLKVDSGSNATSDALAGIFVEGQRSGVVYNLVSNNTANAANRGTGIQFRSGGFLTSGIIGRSDAVAASGDAPGYLTFHTSTDGSEDFAERMRITSSGNLKFASQTTNFESPGFTYHTNNFLYLRGGSAGLILSDDAGQNTIQISDSADYIKFETTDGSERMRIDSSGNIQIRQNTNAPTNSVSLPGHLEFRGQGWDSNSGSDDMNAKIEMDATYGKVGSGATSPELVFSLQGAGGLDSSSEAYVEAMRIVGAGAYNSNTPRIGIGTASPSSILQIGDGTTSEYITIDKSATGESGLLFKNAGNNKGKILLNSNEELKFYINNTTDAMTINETSTGGTTTIPGVQIGNLSHGWGNLAVTSDDSSWDGGITIAAASTSGGTGGYGALFWKQGGIAQANTKWFMGFVNSTSSGAAYDDLVLGAYNLNTGYSRGGRTDGLMHFDRSNGDVHVAKQVNFHGQQGFKVYNSSGFSKGTSWQNISGSITTVDYNNGGWNSSTGRFQPTKAGYYLFTFGGWAAPNSDGSRYATSFSKNTTGQRYISGGDYCAVDSPMNGHSEIIYMNGSTDYVDLYAYSSISTTWGGSSHSVWWGAEFLH